MLQPSSIDRKGMVYADIDARRKIMSDEKNVTMLVQELTEG